MDAHEFLCHGMRNFLTLLLFVLIVRFHGLKVVSMFRVKKKVADLVGGSSGDELMGELGLVRRVDNLGNETRQ